MAKVEILRCKYLLPCGYCDKYDMPCKASKEDTVNFYNIPNAIEETKNSSNNCDHNWEYIYTSLSYPVYEYYRCTKCGETKKMEIEAF